jgi:ring-1,2-phenylacetyl-CoA epoxidase subunit PaaE
MSTQFHSLKVMKLTPEISDASSITFEIPSDLEDKYGYTHGQYLTLKFQINGKEERRAYSMSSSPLENGITVTVKKVVKGIVSNHICTNLKEGDSVEVMVPQGRFTLQLDEEKNRTFYLFGAGSGITPLMSIAKTVLEKEPLSTVFLFYGNRNEESIIFKYQLDEMEKRYQNQFIVCHTLSQPKKEKPGGFGGMFKKTKMSWAGEVGRIDTTSVKKFLGNNPIRSKEMQYFICGPGGMIDEVENALLGMEINKKYVHSERFTAAVTGDESTTHLGAAIPLDGAKLIAHLDGEIIETEVKKGKSILDTLLDLKYEPPYSCCSGSCSTCMAKVVKGKVEMEACYALDDDEIEEGFILTCQSHPTTAEVEITFDV